jgi:hypothetical protein
MCAVKGSETGETFVAVTVLASWYLFVSRVEICSLLFCLASMFVLSSRINFMSIVSLFSWSYHQNYFELEFQCRGYSLGA